MGRQIWTYYEGDWHEGNTPILGAADHGTWLGSLIFDGARAFEGVTPDLDLHCARANQSAGRMGLVSPVSDAEITELAHLLRIQAQAEAQLTCLIILQACIRGDCYCENLLRSFLSHLFDIHTTCC